ncbi:MAG: C25 family cysteine peptidase [candidate division Zixibacteria bacterium]|jgi:hypothetical protein|nr:C25 family cysteine peptidase [candidate division Zixibacteria bacterium]
MKTKLVIVALFAAVCLSNAQVLALGRLLIITNEEMKPAFEHYSEWKSLFGIPADIVTVEYIQTSYAGDSLQVKIRECLRDYHNNHQSDWAILGGDIDIIPHMIVNSLRAHPAGDTYYTNLDGDWNANGNDLFGEPPGYGDQTDYEPDIFVARIPCVDSTQAATVIRKLVEYQSCPADTNYQNEVLLMGTRVIVSIDKSEDFYHPVETEYFLDTLIPHLPANLNRTRLFEEASQTVKTELSAGYGLIVNNSQAQWAGNFLTHWTTTPWHRDAIEFPFMADSMMNTGKYSVFFNSTCLNNCLSSTAAIGRHFMLNPNGGGVAYIGSSNLDWLAASYPDFCYDMMDLMFEDGYEIGKAFALAKAALTPSDAWLDNYRRFAYHAYMLLGDPQLSVFSDVPKTLRSSLSIPLTPGQMTFVVAVISDSGESVAGATVCLTQDSTVYVTRQTDGLGIATFSDVLFEHEGLATIGMMKSGYLMHLDSVFVGACCLGVRGNVNGDQQDICDLADLMFLVNYLLQGGAAPECFDEADLNADGSIDLSDEIYLTNYLFLGGQVPYDCQ